MDKFFGLILLAVAIAGLLFLSTNAGDVTSLKFGLPGFKFFSVQAPEIPTFVPSGMMPADQSISTQKPVTITKIKNSDSMSPYIEMVISANLSQNETIDVTGWTVKSNTNKFFTIPAAQEIYSFGGAQGDIKLRAGDKIHFYSGFGPKGNFRLNKCMGYVEDTSSFTPFFEKNCPSISRSEIQGFSSSCQDYLESLDNCENPLANPPVPFDDNACHEFLRKLNYVGCVEKYGTDKDFLSRDWMVWMGDQMNIFDFVHDKVQLLDKKGNIMDEYIY
ncbi:MAG: hypothetical protein AAB674_02420 [Patescibacteria group bacterium]